MKLSFAECSTTLPVADEIGRESQGWNMQVHIWLLLCSTGESVRYSEIWRFHEEVRLQRFFKTPLRKTKLIWLAGRTYVPIRVWFLFEPVV
jgi:hypothetical protein